MRYRIDIAVFFILLSLVNSGCAAVLLGGGAAAGAGTVLYVKGELQSVEEVPLDRAWNAANLAVRDMGFVIGNSEKDDLSGSLTAYTADNKKVQIKLKRRAESITEIRIRVGTFGDESLSRLILEKIRERL
ncbi:MAG: hypothetical protein KatS3mg078_1474 [Deltaproteobacteria bacterium]|nr:hypothetical protein HRbin37_01075 [bacterium HR37]GIW47597.1 MAG: hypothetical protein KatS3mg078_1474 [Deltaproteobacteria bacterium]